MFTVVECNTIAESISLAMGTYSGKEGLKSYIDDIVADVSSNTTKVDNIIITANSNTDKIGVIEESLKPFPSVDYDFATLFTCNNDVKLTCDSLELNIRNEDTKVISTYTSGDIIAAGTYIIYGKEVDNVLFGELDIDDNQLYDNFFSINIVRNSFQTNAINMFRGLTTLDIFEASKDSFGNVTNFGYTWFRCLRILEFPIIDTSNATSLTYAWVECGLLGTFPFINTTSVVNFSHAWEKCKGLTVFPLIDTSNGEDFERCWSHCMGLVEFPLIDTSKAINFKYTWRSCSSLSHFPLLDSSNVTNFEHTWGGCYQIDYTFPAIDTSNGTNFDGTWFYCSGMRNYSDMDMSNGTTFIGTWGYNLSLISMPIVNLTKATDITAIWVVCPSLVCLAGVINDDANNPTSTNAFTGCHALIEPNSNNQGRIMDGEQWINSNVC